MDTGDTSAPVTVLGNTGNDTLRMNVAAARPVNFNGGTGNDTVYLIGSDGDDTIALTPGSSTLTGPATVNAKAVTQSGIEIRRVDAGAGNDKLVLTENGAFDFNESLNGGEGDDTSPSETRQFPTSGTTP